MLKQLIGAATGATLAFAAATSANAGYANPHLLMEVAELAEGLTVLTEDGGTANDRSGVVLVDVRPQAAFAAGHIPGARHLDPNAVAAPDAPVDGTLRSVAEVAGILAGLGISPESRVVFYDDRGGFHAARMFWVAEYLGHRNVSLLNGGLTAWTAAGHGLETGLRWPPEAARFAPAVSPRRHATADHILAHRDDPATVVLDVRPATLFAKGHIPWARNVPWSGNLAADGTFLPAGALAAHFAAHGVTPDMQVVIHCQNGLASAHSYVALRLLGHPRVRVYHRSWAEWGSDGALPVAAGS